MEQSIKETAQKYSRLAKMLESLEAGEPLCEDVPEDVQAALIRLYYSKAFEAEIEKCEDLLEEETDEDTVDAVIEAAGAVEAASEAAFCEIEAYLRRDRAFEKTIENLSASSGAQGLKDLLYKLYKCEGIIRMAQRCSMKFPLYGAPQNSSRVQQDFEVMDQQQSIEKNVGIDICGLIELREALVAKIGLSLGKDGRFQ